ncbi:MAG TPA: methyltransferase domain-containing protein, partial [Geminicoccaceae bacterium]|nr:methyltransferase domain-containing protein [Geminicoccaceae bacterium]
MVETGAVVTAASESILAQRARGGLSPGMALMCLLLLHRDVEAVRRVLAAAGRGTARRRETARELATLLEDRLDAAGEVVAIAGRADGDGHDAASGADPEGGIERCRRLFNWAVGVNAEASVALYSLGTAALLEPATDEAADLMSTLGVVGSDRHVLDIGCGIGRFELALARRVASITGIDASTAMIEEARRRCEALANVRLLPTSGRDLRPFGDASFDAAVAVDSFPYLYQAGGAA